MRIRPAVASDAEAMRSIYNEEVLSSEITTFDLVPRSSEEQVAWLGRHEGAHPAIVATDDPPQAESSAAERVLDGTGCAGVVGFGALSVYRSRPAYATTVENSVYVRVDHRGQGIGRALLAELIRLATLHGFHCVVARIVKENGASIALHQSCGFELVGTEREIGRKHGRWIDVVELQRML